MLNWLHGRRGWRAARRQAAAHAAIPAALAEGPGSLIALSIHPAGAFGRLKRRYDDPSANCSWVRPRIQ